MQATDLFGPADAAPGSLYDQALERIQMLDEAALNESGVTDSEIYPIAFSVLDLDLFVVTRASSARPGQVIWFAGGQVDRFPDFNEYFASMVSYNQREIEALSK